MNKWLKRIKKNHYLSSLQKLWRLRFELHKNLPLIYPFFNFSDDDYNGRDWYRYHRPPIR